MLAPAEDRISEKKKVLATINEETAFSFEQLFFSRTDGNGIMLSGNQVFQQISQYSWDELIDRPHSLIRHPDMPRAVFWLLWETIKQGHPIGAYVKNRAKDGRYYWVFAIVTPLDRGYLSVRLKPSVLLPVVEGEYKSLVAAAISNKHSPKESAELLLGHLRQLGFRDYESFMATALAKELAARNAILRREPDRIMVCFDNLLVAANSALDHAEKVFAEYERSKHAPLNLRIQAAQLGESAMTIDVISNNYGTVSSAIQDKIQLFVTSAQRVLKTIHEGLFLICTASVQHEVSECFGAEIEAGHFSEQAGGFCPEQEVRLLEAQREEHQAKAIEGLRAIAKQTEAFQQDCDEMKRLTTTLEIIRLMGKMESARLVGINEGLDKLITDLESSQGIIATGLKEIERMNHAIKYNARRTLVLAGCEA
jgi:PAS domain S-box-containing protein